MTTNVIHKFVNDLGIAAYILMHGFVVVGKKDKSIFFECESIEAAEEFDRLILDYQPDNDFIMFDSCLMYLKKINDIKPPKVIDNKIHKVVTDLGVAAYLLLQNSKKEKENKKSFARLVGKENKRMYFEHPEGKGNEFERSGYQYLSSQFKIFDSNLVVLKKINEYIP